MFNCTQENAFENSSRKIVITQHLIEQQSCIKCRWIGQNAGNQFFRIFFAFLSLRTCTERRGESQGNFEDCTDGTYENLREYLRNMKEYEEIRGKYEKNEEIRRNKTEHICVCG